MSPDEREIVFVSDSGGHANLWIASTDGSSARPITFDADPDVAIGVPVWSPRGDLIMFSRQADGDYEINTIKPDGTGVKRLTTARGNDAHMAWSPDGELIAFASTRMGFKDEMTYTDAPQPYGEIFVMRFDGTGLEQLTDDQWEDGTPAFVPTRRQGQ